MKTTVSTFALVALTSSLNAAVLVENFQFADTAGTALNAVTNSGTVGTGWNFAVTNTETTGVQGATDNAGNFIFGFNSDAGSAAIDKDYTRKVEFASAFYN